MPSALTAEEAIEPQSLRRLTLKSLKRTYELFNSFKENGILLDKTSRSICRSIKTQNEYGVVKDLPPPIPSVPPNQKLDTTSAPTSNDKPASSLPKDFHSANTEKNETKSPNVTITTVNPYPYAPGVKLSENTSEVPTLDPEKAKLAIQNATPNALVSTAPGIPDYKNKAGLPERYMPSASVMKRLPSKWPKPSWHPPWKNYRVISGHLGWVRSIAFDPSNEWFCTGSADRTIKIWETATGKLKLTLTGHIEQIRGLAVSSRHPYMFSAGDDKQVKCWDLEYNKVIRSYHGHLSGVYCLALHPTIDILMTGGRDSVCRVWDMRTKAQIFALSGHDNTVCSVITQGTDPQVITGSHDTTIKLWDLAAGKTSATLTFHKKSVRALALHPFEHTFASASADNMKKYKLPKGEFLHNMLSQQRTIVNTMAINEDNVLVSGGDNGSLWFWDWKSGHNFQQAQSIVQPGSLDSEAGIYAQSFDITGTRLVTCEADKTIKMWKEDDTATPETHPIHFKPPKEMRRF